jgi:hypothetical protein
VDAMTAFAVHEWLRSKQPLADWETSLTVHQITMDGDVPCAWEGCETPATWRKTNLCCRLSNPHCAPHKDAADAWMEQYAADGKVAYCVRCHSANHDYRWTEL